MKNQSDALNSLKALVALNQNDLKVKVIKLKSDRGGDFTRNMFKHYLIDSGIQHELTAASAPEQNGFIERSDRTIVDTIIAIRPMLHSVASLRLGLWRQSLYYSSPCMEPGCQCPIEGHHIL